MAHDHEVMLGTILMYFLRVLQELSSLEIVMYELVTSINMDV
jgi:hypothetical protein